MRKLRRRSLKIFEIELMFPLRLFQKIKGFTLRLGGNASVRIEGTEYLAVTPSQREHEELSLDDICVVDFDLNPLVDNGLKPSLEARCTSLFTGTGSM